MMAEELLARVRAEIDARCAELRPATVEYERLLSAAEALGLEPLGSSLRSPGPRATSPRTRNARRSPSRAPRSRAGRRGSAAGAIDAAASASPKAAPRSGSARPTSRPRAPRGAAQQAILAALEHGSHTATELAVVTAMAGPNIRENLRRMLSSGTVSRAKRDGKAAYALALTARRSQ